MLGIYVWSVLASAISLYGTLVPAPSELAYSLAPHWDLLAIVHAGLNVLGIVLVWNMPMMYQRASPAPDADGTHPALDDWATLGQWATFSWLDTLIARGKVSLRVADPSIR